MKLTKSIRPTEEELKVLQVLWRHGPCTVRFVHDRLKEDKNVGYTTTLKIMQKMHDKRLVRRDESSRSHLYHSRLRESDTQQVLLDKLVQVAFGGSAVKLVMQALGNHRATAAEIRQVRELLDKIQGEKQ